MNPLTSARDGGVAQWPGDVDLHAQPLARFTGIAVATLVIVVTVAKKRDA